MPHLSDDWNQSHCHHFWTFSSIHLSLPNLSSSGSRFWPELVPADIMRVGGHFWQVSSSKRLHILIPTFVTGWLNFGNQSSGPPFLSDCKNKSSILCLHFFKPCSSYLPGEQHRTGWIACADTCKSFKNNFFRFTYSKSKCNWPSKRNGIWMWPTFFPDIILNINMCKNDSVQSNHASSCAINMPVI